MAPGQDGTSNRPQRLQMGRRGSHHLGDGNHYLAFIAINILTDQMYIIPGTSGHAQIYTNTKGKRLENFTKFLVERTLSKDVDFGASLFPKGLPINSRG